METAQIRVIGIDKANRGDCLDVYPTEGYARAKLIHKEEHKGLLTVIISWSGYSYNPGSRNSGLLDYIPAMTEIYTHNGETDKNGNKLFNYQASWQTRKPA
jgi:hypothetical protein